MKIAGIILIILQIIAVVGSFIGGRNPFTVGFPGLIGYFIFGIIGVILLIIYYVRKNKK